MRFVFILCSLGITYSSYAFNHVMDSLRSVQRPDGLFVIHRVEEKETLYSITRRYGGSVQQVIEHNQILDNKIDIGQIIEILVVGKEPKISKEEPKKKKGYHVVQKGETLYGISRQYGIKLKELKKWNGLEGNAISLGMQLKISENSNDQEGEELLETEKPLKKDSVINGGSPLETFEKYLVQTGETLSSIAQKIKVDIDSLRLWNELKSDYLQIGQALRFKETEEKSDITIVDEIKGKQVRLDEDGFERIYEEGVASVIESMNTSRFLALHKSLPIGTTIEVRNLMNNQVVHVKVVGKLPNTGLNKKIMVRLSKSAYDQLGILDSKARVEVSYYKN